MSVLELTGITLLGLLALYTLWGLAAYASHDKRRRQQMRDILRRHPDLLDATDARLEALVENERLYELARRDITQLETKRGVETTGRECH